MIKDPLPAHLPLLPDDEHNRRLAAWVGGQTWVNPAPARKYALVIIGGGPAGLVAASVAAGLHARVALIEKNLLGGDCLISGCVPSKAFLHASRLADGRQNAAANFSQAMAHVRKARADLAIHDSAQGLAAKGIDLFFGDARFTSPTSIQVGGAALNFHRALVATGSRPAIPPIPGLADCQPYTSETVFTLTELPRRLAILGGGPIACELGQAFARFGCQVSLIQRAARLLPRDDPQASPLVQAALEQTGATVHLATQVVAAKKETGGLRLELAGPNAPASIQVDAILVAAGRIPNVNNLDLPAAGIGASLQTGIEVNERLQTSNRRVFAAGDCCSSFKFTHAADAMARLAVRNALFWGRGRHTRLHIPWCTYTTPEVAGVGLSEAEAAKKYSHVQTYQVLLEAVDRAQLDACPSGFVRVVTRGRMGVIVGGSIVGLRAGEMIATLTLAMQNRIKVGELASLITPYPSYADAIRKLGDQFQSGRLKPWHAPLLRAWWKLWAS